ncbi:MAG: hypothetical protein DDT28_00301 [Dehalococcoidia bacterium]|nr:hypothetical protein [Chloroflexota bacterium]
MNRKTFKPGGLPTAIGSMPHTDPVEACSIVRANLPEIPVWPQLPRRSFLESMYTQFSEGFPGLVQGSERIYVNRSVDLSEPLERLYTEYRVLSTEYRVPPTPPGTRCSALGTRHSELGAVSPEYALGLQQFLSHLSTEYRVLSTETFPLGTRNSELGTRIYAVKGQVIGPVSFGLMVTDQNRRPILYDDALADALAKHLALKARWQERELSRLSSNTIIFIDEPYLASLGSAFVAVSTDMVISLIDETLGGLSGLKGIHCCGNADWPVLMNTTIDILSFDAYNYGESLTLYPAEIKAFIDRGGVLAWGIVPSDEAMLSDETASKLLGRLEKLMGLLSESGIGYDRLCEQSLITPSCGLASISPRSAERALELTAEVSREFRRLQLKGGRDKRGCSSWRGNDQVRRLGKHQHRDVL